ncbi:MAG: outer membrane protein assembly factor BamA [Deltaproteobacteria bacterium]|nr:outer membrane protein assembly factor BamA [Deltaproteobacteria bacterium]
MIYKTFGPIGIKQIHILAILFGWIACILFPVEVKGEDNEQIIILPFEVHSLVPMDHLKIGIQEMLTSRLEDKGLRVTDMTKVNQYVSTLPTQAGREDLRAIGKKLGATWVIRGSLTQIGNTISLDTKFLETSSVQPASSIFVEEDGLDRLENAVERVATHIFKSITGIIQIYQIRITGNKRIESEAILAVIESKEGDEPNSNQLDKDLRAIYRMGYFEDVRIEIEDDPRGKVVIFYIIEKPSIAKIFFEGNEDLEDDDLLEQLGVKKYSILNLNEIKQSINRLKEYYREKGYYNVEITESIEDLPENEVSLTYQVSEGEKIYIKNIQFIGNEQIDADELKDEMETSEKGCFFFISGSGKLDKKKLEFDVHRLAAFYHNNGFIKVKIGEPKVTYDEEVEGLTITIDIIEGPQYKVDGVNIEGDLIKPLDELLATLNIKQGTLFSREVVRTDTMRLGEIYSEQGFAYADVTPITKEDEENHLVDITYKITKGERVRFERINITGNTITRDKVIRREFKFAEGDYFNGKELKQGTRNLYRLDFFETVDIQTKKGEDDDLMILDVDVKEKPTGQFAFGVGYSSYEKTVSTLELSKRNFNGKGQEVSARATFGSRTKNYNVSFIEPWLFDRPLSAGISLYKWVYDSEYNQYDQDTQGGSLTFGFPLKVDDYTRGSVQYALDESEIYNIATDASQEVKNQAGTQVTSSMTFSMTRDSKNRHFLASEGSLNSLSYEYAGRLLDGDSSFDKYNLRSAWYFPLPLDNIFMAQFRAGIVRKKSEGTLPIGEKFKLGGINTVRGYSYGEISPKSSDGYNIGGEDMWVFNLEYLFPLQKEQGVMGLLLYDAGNVYRKEDDDFFNYPKQSIGGGIRWLTPLGLLRLEYGRKLDPEPGESKDDWEFTIGGAF